VGGGGRWVGGVDVLKGEGFGAGILWQTCWV